MKTERHGDRAMAGVRGPLERRMASRVAVRSAGWGERVIAGRLPTPEPPLGDGGSREAHPSERRCTGEPSPARQQPPNPAIALANGDR